MVGILFLLHIGPRYFALSGTPLPSYLSQWHIPRWMMKQDTPKLRARMHLGCHQREKGSTFLELTGWMPSEAALGPPALLLAVSMGKGERGSELLPVKTARARLPELGWRSAEAKNQNASIPNYSFLPKAWYPPKQLGRPQPLLWSGINADLQLDKRGSLSNTT